MNEKKDLKPDSCSHYKDYIYCMFHLRLSVYQDLNIIIPMRRGRHKELK